jgi:hypothetical protein
MASWGAAVHAVAAEDALTVLHFFPLYHAVDVQAHGAVSRAYLAVGAVICFSHQPQRRPPEQVTNRSPDDHERRHPADGVAACPPSKDHGQSEKKGNDDIVDEKPGRASIAQRQGHGHTGLQLVQGVHGMVATRANGQRGDQTDPRDPDNPLPGQPSSRSSPPSGLCRAR